MATANGDVQMDQGVTLPVGRRVGGTPRVVDMACRAAFSDPRTSVEAVRLVRSEELNLSTHSTHDQDSVHPEGAVAR